MMKILENFDLKWWSSLDAQQKLIVGMAVIIFALSGVSVMLFRSNEKNKIEAEARYDTLRLTKNVEIASEKAGKEACYQSQIIYLKENEKRYQNLFFTTKRLETKLNENTNN